MGYALEKREKTESFVYPKFLRQIVTLQHYNVLKMFAVFGHMYLDTFGRVFMSKCSRHYNFDEF